MSYAQTTLIKSTITTSHGQLSTISLPEAMDVDTDHGRRAQDQATLDKTLGRSRIPATEHPTTLSPVTCELPAIQPPTTILDRPREIEGTVQPVSNQNGKASY